jgi:transcriptional regulator with XRE-family HTH domain
MTAISQPVLRAQPAGPKIANPGNAAAAVRRPARKPRPRLRTPIDHQRSEFLRQCRARTSPEEVGLPRSSRARSGGLRREDVAALAGVSTSWYTWLEQGRDIRVSDDALERISLALRLSVDERTYLFALVQQRLPRPVEEIPMVAPPEVRRVLDAMPFPAIAKNLRSDVLAWNAISKILYRDYGSYSPEERNLLMIRFLRPMQNVPLAELEATNARLLAGLRFDYSMCAGDAKFDDLIRSLLTHSPMFRRMWRTPDFRIGSYGPHQFDHPRFGALSFEHTHLVPDGHPCIRLVLCNPDDASTREAVATVRAELQVARQE